MYTMYKNSTNHIKKANVILFAVIFPHVYFIYIKEGFARIYLISFANSSFAYNIKKRKCADFRLVYINCNNTSKNVNLDYVKRRL